MSAESLRQKPFTQQFENSPPCNFLAALLTWLIILQILFVRLDCGGKCLDTRIFSCNSLNNRRHPEVRTHRKGEQGFKFLFSPENTIPVGLVYDKDVTDFHDSGFDRLYIVAHSRDKNHNRNIRGFYDLDLVLANSNSFNN